MILEVIYCTPLGVRTNTEKLTFSIPRGVIMIPEGKSTLIVTVTNIAALGCLRNQRRLREMWKRLHVKLN